MKISPFTPIFFAPTTDTSGLQSLYVQTFAPTDKILLEVICDDGESEPAAIITDLVRDVVYDTIVWQSWNVNSVRTLYYRELNGMSDGYYSITIDGVESEPFRITSDVNELRRTTLLQYSNNDNKQRSDALFLIDLVHYYFDFRVPGGFKDSGWSFGVDNEQFSTQQGYTVELYSREVSKRALAIGNGVGVPIWFAEHLNRLLTCNYVYIDKQRYVRDGESVPEISAISELTNSFTIVQQLKKVVTPNAEIEEENQILIRRADEAYYRNVESGDSVAPLIIQQ